MKYASILVLAALLSGSAFAEGPIIIYLAGDSTMAEKLPDKRPETGRGEALQRFFDPDKVRIENHAKNSRTFIEEKLWQAHHRQDEERRHASQERKSPETIRR